MYKKTRNIPLLW